MLKYSKKQSQICYFRMEIDYSHFIIFTCQILYNSPDISPQKTTSVTHTNKISMRHRRQIYSESEQSVSIFDSDEEYEAPKPQPEKLRNKIKEPPARGGLYRKSIERKLEQDQQKIMRQINGQPQPQPQPQPNIDEYTPSPQCSQESKVQSQSKRQLENTQQESNPFFQHKPKPHEVQLTWDDLRALTGHKPIHYNKQSEFTTPTHHNGLFSTQTNGNSNIIYHQVKAVDSQKRPVGRPKKKQGPLLFERALSKYAIPSTPHSNPYPNTTSSSNPYLNTNPYDNFNPYLKHSLKHNLYAGQLNHLQTEQRKRPLQLNSAFQSPNLNNNNERSFNHGLSDVLDFHNNRAQTYFQQNKVSEINNKVQGPEKVKQEDDFKFDIDGLDDELYGECWTEEEKEATTKEQKKKKRDRLLSDIKKLQQEYYKLEDDLQEEEPTLKQVSQKLKIKKSIAGRLLQCWKYKPQLLVPFGNIKRPSEEFSKGKSKCQLRVGLLEQLIERNPFLTQCEMAEVLRIIDPEMNAKIDRSAVLRVLKPCGIIKKKTEPATNNRNTTDIINLRHEYATLLKQFKANNYRIHFYDEYILHEFFDKDSGWCKSNEEVKFTVQKFINRSIILKVLLTEDGRCRWDVRFGNAKQQDFCKILSDLLKDAGQHQQKNVLVVNPLNYRQPKLFEQITERRGWQFLVLPCHSPQLNPARVYFSQIREMLKRRKFQTLEQMYLEVVRVLREGDSVNMGTRAVSRIDQYLSLAFMRMNL